MQSTVGWSSPVSLYKILNSRALNSRGTGLKVGAHGGQLDGAAVFFFLPIGKINFFSCLLQKKNYVLLLGCKLFSSVERSQQKCHCYLQLSFSSYKMGESANILTCMLWKLGLGSTIPEQENISGSRERDIDQYCLIQRIIPSIFALHFKHAHKGNAWNSIQSSLAVRLLNSRSIKRKLQYDLLCRNFQYSHQLRPWGSTQYVMEI
jgi:hypothetical protein